jgi:phytanoyl-CoA dioxygenase PhyH
VNAHLLAPLGRAAMAPLWAAQLLTAAKSFERNQLIGSPRLNRHGLHAARVTAAHRLAAARRHRLAALVSEADRQDFARDGFVIRRDFLPAAEFAALLGEIRGYRGALREIAEGDTLMRKIALAPRTLAALPALGRLLRSNEWRGLIRYVGSRDAEPVGWIQSILRHACEGPPDPQTALHADTFHPTVKAWLFLTDVEPDAMPFVYVPGSHRVTPERLAWERRMSIAASATPAAGQQRLVRAISPASVAELGLPAPVAISAPANTLVVADTFGFHARGASARPTTRVEIWAMGRRNPFLPWTGLDPWSLDALGLRKPIFYWRSVDLMERLGLGRQRWRSRGSVSAFDPA